MRIGFLFDAFDPGPDAFSPFKPDRIVKAQQLTLSADEALAYLRPGDTVIVFELGRLGRTLNDIILLSERLREADIGLISIKEGITPDAPIGECYFQICSWFAEQLRAELSGMRKRGRRGRPTALSKEDQDRAASLLQRVSVLQVARLLKVSPATIYRYFPRKRSQRRSVHRRAAILCLLMLGSWLLECQRDVLLFPFM